MCAARLAAAAAAQSVYAFSVRPLAGGEPVSLGSLRGKENAKNEEILDSLKYVRPGCGFEPNFTLFEKCEVNGAGAHPLFTFLREALPTPSDDATALMTDPKLITWSPVCRNDVAWNFEKFLVGPDGVPVRRYSRRFPTIDIEPDIEALLSQKPSCV
ncbi:glutathione peroxidase 1 isoform X2 [Carlito syrichta]|uniref:Glutathione peroxidase 1 n=1 Tax=Carlito syrichta TaxID=1868482 RepID=A0A3Q0DQA9_CARSF|nr:glutathione peroxidase 1 isoform X2 [Carlito syrichta]